MWFPICIVQHETELYRYVQQWLVCLDVDSDRWLAHTLAHSQEDEFFCY
jgi:hypothetical protein